MGRRGALLSFWLVGFLLGAFAWLVKTPVIQFLQNVGLTAEAGQALLAGLFGSTVMVLAVLVWSFMSSS